ncbi:MAG: hypothetical protein JWM43_5 [Acidobacteriaceae bacterium]|nr:hypothetical protein [Acidobacteriaceae bacterium]
MIDVLELETAIESPSANDGNFYLSDVEVETLRRAAKERRLPFDPQRRSYSRTELADYGMVREGYTREELRELGIGPEAVSCFDERAMMAEELLPVETPFGSGIKKWQLPIDMMPMRVHLTVFPPNTTVRKHVHPASTPEAPGGGLRIVSKGRIFYEGREYGPGDWFFVPNGTAYAFTTDPDTPTIVFYKYAFFGFEQGNRFSHPHGVE